MKALVTLPAALLLALAAGSPAAAAPWADNPEQIIDDCSDSDLPSEVVSYCLRNLHRLNETSPTRESEALEAQLQRRADGLDTRPSDRDGYDDDDSDEPPADRTDRDGSSYDDEKKSDDIAGPNDQNYDDDRPNDSDSDADSDRDDQDSDDDEPPPPERPNSY